MFDKKIIFALGLIVSCMFIKLEAAAKPTFGGVAGVLEKQCAGDQKAQELAQLIKGFIKLCNQNCGFSLTAASKITNLEYYCMKNFKGYAEHKKKLNKQAEHDGKGIVGKGKAEAGKPAAKKTKVS